MAYDQNQKMPLAPTHSFINIKVKCENLLFIYSPVSDSFELVGPSNFILRTLSDVIKIYYAVLSERKNHNYNFMALSGYTMEHNKY